MRLSSSGLKTWGACALQAKYHYVDKLPEQQSAASTFGTCVHDAIELFLVCRDVDEAVERFLHVWDHPEVLDIVPDFYFRRTSFGYYRERGMEMVRAYAAEFDFNSIEILAIEHPFHLEFGEHQLSGFIDILQIKNGVLQIVDLKSGQPPVKADLRLDVQFTVYCYASMQEEFWDTIPNGPELFKRFDGEQRDMIWWDLRNKKPLNAGERHEGDFRRMYHATEQVAKALEHEVFVPTITGATCGFCSYKDVCEAYSPVPEGVAIGERRPERILL